MASVEAVPRVTLPVMTLDELNVMKTVMPIVKSERVDQILVADGGSTDGTVEWGLDCPGSS